MVPLQTMTAFSLLRSPMTPQQLIKAVQDKGYQAVALTDYNVLYGMYDFYQAAQAADIQPILGLTAELIGLQSSQSYPVIFLVENQVGYHNLLQISSAINTQNEKMTLDDLKSYLSGLYIILPSIGELAVLLGTESERAMTLVKTVTALSDATHVFLGVSLDMREAMLQSIKELAQNTGTRIIANENVLYPNASDQFSAQVIQKLGQGEIISNVGLAQKQAATAYLKESTDWANEYNSHGLSDAVENTDWVAAHSHVVLEQSSVTVPKYETPQGQSSSDYLAELATTGLTNRLHDMAVDATPYKARLKEELRIINELGFADYFLIVWDVLNYAHKKSIRTGPGRGSAAGSLVAYVLWITDVDPIAYDLLFERFLNPERHQMPDIDIDIPDNRREEILDYLHEHYGHERVAQIITFSTMAQRAVIRDVARVFGLNPTQIDNLSKSMPRGTASLQASYESSLPFRNALLDLPVDGQLLYQTALKLEGLPRNASLHAAGVVLSAEPLANYMPVQLGDDGRLVTQLPKGPVEALGLLKMDFLALSNLNILDIAIREIQKIPDHESFNIASVSLDDQATLRLFQNGLTNGVFQFESGGMKNILRQLRPDSFEDIVAANALFRPGPMQNIPHFVARKHQEEKQDVPDASMAEILAPTYGIIVYQEQVMRVAERFAGFSLGEADLLRRAMSKKDHDKIAAMQSKFIDGAVGRHHDQQVAEQVFSYIETFAQYGFNRSHAVAYSKLAFQLAYIKAHYPAAFYKAVLNDSIADHKKVGIYIAEAKLSHVTILRPSLNHSWQGYSMNKQGELQMGLASISGLRRDFREALIQERQEGGQYRDLTNFIGRLPSKYRKVSQLEPLIYAGALDEFGFNRKTLLGSMQGYIDAVGLAGESISLFESLTPKMHEVAEFPLNEKLGYEHEYLGVYLSGHPIEPYLAAIPENRRTDIANLAVGMTSVTVVIYVQNVKKIRTKKGDPMAFVDGIDLTGTLSITIFPTVFKKIEPLLVNEKVLLITGKIEQQRGRDTLQMIANQVINGDELLAESSVSEKAAASTGQWYFRIMASAEDAGVMPALQNILRQHHGANPVLIVFERDHRKIALNETYWLTADDETGEAIRSILGENNVVFKSIQ
ncbi:DNA polymerase III subunit alpha [Weissella paramesenteroides]|uniref:DNA polymerase III subunit alpha n=1 Tax=Weissella paramesenteroides TaxID=1249 RepID=UPI00207484F2|nr:DNA polymerase III subunit alpha [Weissella paramesenteroides]MCM6765451.1 DNA polymerase III subunit alpha [Weissella paramesenteroides]MCM6766822.1 DNA polymerase III subunit alpha [Weissella paramesenteroides]MCM6769227.1 DNA polymerase III subunit alpha [Weissella paramesenteroides]MCM6771414.1 DNA polymerase III subunit alpha [Weissella paramesenteroides]MCM6779493.1 DNA polymerase III subunit alpha [Weissella paramesenteroides]